MNKTKIFNWEKEHSYHPKLLLNKWNKKLLKRNFNTKDAIHGNIAEQETVTRKWNDTFEPEEEKFCIFDLLKKIHHKAASVSSGVFVIKEKSEKSCSTE